jgi:DNA (cytosine-5)-methyltransferase 1
VKPLTVGSLFAGIGGFDLGLERAGGFEIRWQVEIDEYCRRVLAKHWPSVQRYGDIREVHDVERVDVLCGGFPCQDISNAGNRAGINGERSGLWSEYVRLIRLVRPRYVLVENVAALLESGMGRVLGDLAGCGYDAEWSTVSACSMGATHLRRRMFIVANSDRVDGRQRFWDSNARAFRPLQAFDGFESARTRQRERLANPSELYGGTYGLAFGMDRNRAIGNSVYPDCVEWIGNQILAYELALPDLNRSSQ